MRCEAWHTVTRYHLRLGPTVMELVDRYLSLKRGVRHNTVANYNFVRNVLAKEEFNAKRIDKVKLSDAKLFLIKIQEKDSRG